MNHKGIVFGLILAAMVPLVSAVNCWGINEMPEDSWSWSAWLCNSTQPAGYYKSGTGVYPFSIMMHGQIETEAPPEHPNASSVWRVYLVGFQYSLGLGYPATLKCYKRMGSSGRYWWWYTGQQETLTGGQFTPDDFEWVLAGCPPVTNGNHESGSPPKVQIGVAWDGFGKRAGGGKQVAESTVLPTRARSRR
ncbi:hypothetical protein COT29_01300 [Candidatus Micrarchaeota archaeon CG08_land_8_20_14_0_20_59_11]|nr:MAG: hypothetical protein COT29_01300 [Candidatus Micrarchaeota archaeon CG08_land_8_20_14_0_20_59_11]